MWVCFPFSFSLEIFSRRLRCYIRRADRLSRFLGQFIILNSRPILSCFWRFSKTVCGLEASISRHNLDSWGEKGCRINRIPIRQFKLLTIIPFARHTSSEPCPSRRLEKMIFKNPCFFRLLIFGRAFWSNGVDLFDVHCKLHRSAEEA